MKIKIFQVDLDNPEAVRTYAFRTMSALCKEIGSDAVDRNAYKLVWEGEVPDDSDLEIVYQIFNLEKPEDFKGHSLSVSDIVETKDGLFYCDVFGWKPVIFR